MGNIAMVLAGISTIEKCLPVVETVGKQIGPLVEAEVSDGKVIWADLGKCWNDFKIALEAVKAAANPPGK